MSDHDQGESLRELATDETEERRLPGHYCDVTMADGTVHRVRITNREYVAWDMTAPRHRWGTAKEAPFLSATFMAYAGLKREGKLPAKYTFDQFREDAEDVSSVPEDDELGEAGARPTLPVPLPGSS